MAKDSVIATCAICGHLMPKGEEMFMYHGFSGPCPAKAAVDAVMAIDEVVKQRTPEIIDDGCATCDELQEEAETLRGECPNAKRDCGHHCNCIWTYDVCCWCGAQAEVEDNTDVDS